MSTFIYWIFGISFFVFIVTYAAKAFFRKKENQKLYIAKCGHKTKRVDVVTAFEESIQCKIPLNSDGVPEYCHHCLQDMAIPCAWCGKPIFIGDPITLYASLDDEQKMPEYAVAYNRDFYVGCLRVGCAITSADRMGFWYPPGMVYRVLSPIEECVQKGEAVIVEDIADISQAIPAREKLS